MVFATGGLAATRLRVSNTFTDSNVAPGLLETASVSKRLTGWTMGGGFEKALSNRWTIKVEYLYVQFGGAT